MKIGKLEISKTQPLIIAEIGINHSGSLALAKQMVKAAIEGGADIIKHQTHIVEDEMTAEAKNVIPPNDPRSIWQIMKDTSLSLEEEVELKNYTESMGGTYISTPFSRAAADFLNSIDVPAFKIGSGECSNLALVKHISNFGKPVIMSTGMHSLDQISKSVDILEKSGVQYALLECTNLYPSPPENVSLQGILDLQKAFPNAVVGFSDHSIGPHMAIASVALGAKIIERHFTDTRYRKGPDIINSMDPSELRFLKDRSKEIAVALNNPKIRTKEEESVYAFARSSIVADKDLEPGTVLKETDIWARRPGTGPISGELFYEIVGKRLVNYKSKNDYIEFNDLE